MRSAPNWLRFLREFLAAPGVTGAVAPSSSALARQMVAWPDLGHARVVVEYGAGTGAFTEHILTRLPVDCRFFAIEVNPRLASIFRQRYPGVRLHVDSVRNIHALCREDGIGEVDCIISGLPWASFQDTEQSGFLEAMMPVLRPGGQFVTFAYLHGLLLPAGARFRRKLGRYFSHVSRSRIVWLNLPPALVYQCRR